MFKNILLLTVIPLINCCKVLTLSGGGVYGSFEAGVLSKLFEQNSTYDIITGISSGSLNTGYLSSIKSGEEYKYINDFKNLWTNISDKEIYSNIYFLNGLSLYDNTPLKHKLTEIYSSRKPIRPIKIGASSLKEGKTKIFTEDDILTHGFIDILMSSTAIPIAFPPHQFLDDIFVDGGLTSNVLLNEGIDYCLKNFPDDKIYVDVIICGKKLSIDISLSMHTKDIFIRIISILLQQVEYSEILHPILEDNIFITVYEQKHEDSYGMLDFTASETLYYEGYNFSNVNVYWINKTIIE